MEIWKYIQEHDNGITNFHFEISADLLNGEELALLAKMRPGLVQLEIGVQSTNLQTLEAVRRQGKYSYKDASDESRFQFARDMKAEGFTGNAVSIYIVKSR